MATNLEGGERLVLTALRNIQGDTTDYVGDDRLAAATSMFVQDVRDLLKTLEGKGLVERSRGIDGFRAYVTAKGRQVLRLYEPMPAAVGTVPRPTSLNPGPLSSGGAGPSAVRLPGDESRPNSIGPIYVFYSYSHKDESLRDELAEHLSLLQREGIIAGWHDRRIGAGDEWAGEIDEYLNTSRIILLLVSPSFMASNYCYKIEMPRALERHGRGEAKVIPIILRPVDWKTAPFAKLGVLPKDGKPVTSWSDRDEAFLDVALGIRRAVETMTANPR